MTTESEWRERALKAEATLADCECDFDSVNQSLADARKKLAESEAACAVMRSALERCRTALLEAGLDESQRILLDEIRSLLTGAL